MKARRSPRLVIFVLFVASLATSAVAQLAPRERQVPAKRTDAWIARARSIQDRIGKGDFVVADREATLLLGEMLQSITVGPDAGRLLALPLSLRAVARAGLERDRDALWDLQAATEVHPATAQVPLAPYGDAGARLARLREASDAAPATPRQPGKEATEEERARWQKPERLSGDQPSYPSAYREATREARIVVEVTVGTDGQVSNPRIVDLEQGGAVMAIASLESIRTWKFRPGRFDGMPTELRYSAVFSFRLESGL